MGKMYKKSLALAACATLLLITNTVNAEANYSFNTKNQGNYSTLKGNVTYVPVGTTTSAILSQALDSKTCTKGMSVYAILDKDFKYNNIKVASAGSTLNGTVVKCKKAGIGNRNGQIEIRFTSIRTPEGYNIPVSGVILTTDGSGVLKGGATKDSAKDYGKNVAIGAAGGAILGTAMGPLSGGEVGKGAVYGTAVGAGIGLIKGAINKGENILIPANSQINLYFDQPITLGAQ